MGVQTDHVGGPEPELQGGDLKLVRELRAARRREYAARPHGT
jgi:hypothetical protein